MRLNSEQNIKEFKEQFKAITKKHVLITVTKQEIRKKAKGDEYKRDEHKFFQLENIEYLDSLRGELKALLGGIDYDEWRLANKKLTHIKWRIGVLNKRRIEMEQELMKKTITLRLNKGKK